MPSTGDLACNPGMCPDWESNQWPFGSQAVLSPLSHTSQGLFLTKMLVVIPALHSGLTNGLWSAGWKNCFISWMWQIRLWRWRKSTEPRGWVFAYFWQVCRTLFFSCPSFPKSFPLPPPPQLTSPREAHGTCPKQFKKPKGKDSPGRLISLVFLSMSWDGAETGPKKLFLARFVNEVTGRGTLGSPWLLTA